MVYSLHHIIIVNFIYMLVKLDIYKHVSIDQLSKM